MSESRRIDWKRHDVGRIHIVAGGSAKERNAFVHLLDELYQMNCLDALHALKRGDISAKQLMAEKRAGRHLELDIILNTKLTLPLWATLKVMVKERPGGEKHRRRMNDSIAKMERLSGLPIGATIADLRKLGRARLRPLAKSSSDWNHLRKAILTPLTQLFGDPQHPFRREILKLLGPAEREKPRPLSVTPGMFWALVDAMPEHAKASIVTLAVTGMRLNTEYLRCKAEHLRPTGFGVYCPGSKNADAQNIIHVAASMWGWVEKGIPSKIQEKQLRTHFHKARLIAGCPDLTLHDLRHLTAIFAFAGGASLNEVQAMMRHADPSMTMHYARVTDKGEAAEAIGRAMARPEVPNRAD